MDIFQESEKIFKKLKKIEKFTSKYQVIPYKEIEQSLHEITALLEQIPEIENPKNRDELLQAELKRSLEGECAYLNHELIGGYYNFDSIISMFAIPKIDLDRLKPWLLENKENVKDFIEELFHEKRVENFELDLSTDIPRIRRQAEEFVATHIEQYHTVLGKMLQELTSAGEFLRDIKAVPTSRGRSYFNLLTNQVALGIQAICYMTENSTLHINERELIKLYGHEGMGHALNQVITKTNNLPYFLTRDSRSARSTGESIAMFYEEQIFEDLKDSIITQKALGIDHKFDEIYQDTKDIEKTQEFQLKLVQYSIMVLADKTLGDPTSAETMRKKIDLIGEVSIAPYFPIHFIEKNKYSFDSQGNLSPTLVSELIYCAKPAVKRVLEEFEKQGIKYEGEGRNLIDMTLLKGFWTSEGLVQNARVTAEEYKQKQNLN